MVNKKLERDREVLVSFSLRIGLAVVFFYAAIAAFLDPNSWIGFIPLFVRSIIGPLTFLHIHSFAEIVLGLWLLSNKKTFYAAILSALAIVSILIFNVGALDIIFRDVAIFFMAVALSILSYKNR